LQETNRFFYFCTIEIGEMPGGCTAGCCVISVMCQEWAQKAKNVGRVYCCHRAQAWQISSAASRQGEQGLQLGRAPELASARSAAGRPCASAMAVVSIMARLRRQPNSVPVPPQGPRRAMEQNRHRWNLRVPPREYAPASMPSSSSLRLRQQMTLVQVAHASSSAFTSARSSTQERANGTFSTQRSGSTTTNMRA